MATCKDCLNYELCKYNTYQQAHYFGKDKEILITIDNNSPCKFFKNKANFVELPCKVGDDVYFANESYHKSAEIDGIHIDEQGIMFTWVQYDFGVDITELWDEGEFDIDEIGKTVFLTIEEAEQAEQALNGGVNNGRK